MKIDINEVFARQAQRNKWNRQKTEDVVFCVGDNILKPTKKQIDEWNMTGMNIVDFILTNNWSKSKEIKR